MQKTCENYTRNDDITTKGFNWVKLSDKKFRYTPKEYLVQEYEPFSATNEADCEINEF